MGARETSSRVVVEVGRRGKLVAGEPYFTPGVPIVLDSKGLGDLRPGDLAVVRTGRGRRARVERGLGSAQRIENVLEALLVEQGARVEFEPHDVPEPSLDGRVDLRELTSFTIDPETAKDFDDALSFRREPDGIRAWVHIADVSYFVPAGQPARPRRSAACVLDVRARARRADAAARARRRRLLAAAAPGPALRHGRDPAERRAALLPLRDPLERAAHLRRGRSAARRRREILEQLDARRRARDGAAGAALRARRARGDDARDRLPLRRTAASPTRGRRASRTRTCSSRS